MLIRIAITVLFLPVFFMTATSANGQAAEGERPAGLDEMIQSWKSYQSEFERYQGQIDIIRRLPSVTLTGTTQVRFRKGHSLIEDMEVGAIGSASVMQRSLRLVAWNSKYVFELNRLSSESDWVLRQIEPIEEIDNAGGWRTLLQTVNPTFLEGASLVDIVSDSNFVVKKLAANLDGSVEIEFEYSAAASDIDDDEILGGVLTLDSKHMYRLVGANVRRKRGDGTGVRDYRFEYSDEDEEAFGLPKMARIVASEDGAVMDDMECTLNLVRVTEPPDKDLFRLSGYGFPEPLEPGWSTGRWVAIVGVGCFFFAFFASIIRRRWPRSS